MGSISPRDFIDVVYFKHYEGNFDIICGELKHFAHVLELLCVIKNVLPLIVSINSLEETIVSILLFVYSVQPKSLCHVHRPGILPNPRGAV